MTPHRYDYAWEKLSLAMKELATTDSALRDRVIAAALAAGHLESRHFPESMRQDWESLKSAVTKLPPINDEGRYHATVRAMEDNEVQGIADGLLSLFESVCHARGEAQG